MTLTPDRREALARKGRLLHEKACEGRPGGSSCAESFARRHLSRGESEVVQDLLDHLHSRVVALRLNDPDGRLPASVELADRLTRLLRP